MHRKETYPIPPTNEAFQSWTDIDVPIIPEARDEEDRANKRAINFNVRMRVLDFYVEDCTASPYWCSTGKPWHIVEITQRYANGDGYHFFNTWSHETKEEAVLLAQLANWLIHDERARSDLRYRRFAYEIEGPYGRDYWIDWLQRFPYRPL